MKKLCLMIIAILLLSLLGCEKAPGEETLPSTTETTPTTLPPETTVPPTTPPPETTEPTLPGVEAEYIVYEEPPIKFTADPDGNLVAENGENPYLKAGYVRLSQSASFSMRPYDNGVFWICADENEGNRGSHYDLYALEDGQLKKLENRSISRSISVMGTTVKLEREYAIHNGELFWTYAPAGEAGDSVSVYGKANGSDDRLLRVKLTAGEEEYIHYFVLFNLETGKVTDFLSGFDRSVFKSSVSDLKDYRFIQWSENNSFVAAVGYGADICYYFFDVPGKTVTENYTYEEQTDDYSEDRACRAIKLVDFVSVYDPLDDEEVSFWLPEGWPRSTKWSQSNDGRKLLATQKDENGVTQILVFDSDTNRLYEIRRTDPCIGEREMWDWSQEGELIVFSDDRKCFCIYSFAVE